MKRIISYMMAAGVLLAAAACQKPHYVLPTADRDGFTSLSAYITSGQYNGSELAKLTVTDEMIADGRLEIKIPYYYPETSDDATTKYLASVRMKAELGKNCYLSPALTLLDLNLDNDFTYTDAQGREWPIVITGKRTKSDEASLISFSLVDMFDGFVDNDARKIYLYTTDDLSSCTAEAEVSAHASIKTDLGVKRNYNETQEIVIAAHSGKEYTYTTEKAVPTKIRSGFNASSVKHLFSFDPKSRLGTPDYLTEGLSPSLASIGGSLIVCIGDGSTPFYINGTTGAKIGDIALGSASPGSVTNDEAGNLLICNTLLADPYKGKLQIYRTSSVTAAPTLFYEYDNQTGLPLGPHMKVSGDIDGDAVITFPYGGVPGVTSSSQFLSITVKGGVVTDAMVSDVAGLGLSWGTFSTGSAGVVPASSDPADGCFLAYYDANTVNYLTQSPLAVAKSMPTTDGNSWAWNVNTMDCKFYNNVNYLALLVLGHFPAWGGQPYLYVYNVNDKNTLSGEFTSSDALVLSYSDFTTANGVNADGTVSSGDVVIAQSADGFKIFIYYYDQYCGVIGGFSADCIKR